MKRKMKQYKILLMILWIDFVLGRQPKGIDYFIEKQLFRAPKQVACSYNNQPGDPLCCDGRDYANECVARCSLGSTSHCSFGPCRCSCPRNCEPMCCRGMQQYRHACVAMCHGESMQTCRFGDCKLPNRSGFKINYQC